MAVTLAESAGRLLDTARSIAEDVLFPAARAVDLADRVPAGHLDLLAAQGFYGLTSAALLVRPKCRPTTSAALLVRPKCRPTTRELSAPELGRIVETLASGCLATTFVWLQHQGALRAAADSTRPGIRDRWYEPLSQGQRRAGVALGALRPGPPSVRARRVEGGYVIDGEAPWVTGWDMVDTLYTTARDEQDTVVWALLDATVGDALSVEPLDLVAVRASRTVLVRFDGYFVPDERVTRVGPHAEWAARDAASLRLNGSLALGVAARCVALSNSEPLRRSLDRCRAALDDGTPESMPDARAAAAALAARAAAVLTAVHGARAVLRGSHPERLTREALFMLVFGSRPSIKAALLRRLAG